LPSNSTPLIWEAHLRKCLRKALHILFQRWTEFLPFTGLFQISITQSLKSSWVNQLSSSLNSFPFPLKAGVPVSKSRGVWSDTPLSKVCSETKGYLNSHSVDIRALSNLSYVGLGSELAQVNCRPKSVSQRSKLSITALNRKGQRSTYVSLFLSLLDLKILKSPPINVGKGFCWHALTSSAKKADIKSS